MPEYVAGPTKMVRSGYLSSPSVAAAAVAAATAQANDFPVCSRKESLHTYIPRSLVLGEYLGR